MAKIISTLRRFWKNLSIVKKIYIVVGMMTVFIAAELVMLMFVIQTLSAVRAFVEGEGLWSKAQKDAVYSLRQYAAYRDPSYYYQFKDYLRVPHGDRRGRLELDKPNPDLGVVYQGFVDGRIHPDDIPDVIWLYRNFRNVYYIDRVVRIWIEGDRMLDELVVEADRLHKIISAPKRDQLEINQIMRSVDELNNKLTVLEDDFSYTLGEGSRWIERIMVGLVFSAVALIGFAGLTIAYVLGRRLGKGLREVSTMADHIGQGNFNLRLPVQSKDEIGAVSQAINLMTDALEKNDWALKVRDEFISVASHELKTPITALKMNLDLSQRMISGLSQKQQLPDNLAKGIDSASRQVDRLTQLIDDLLDLTRIRSGKLSYNLEPLDFCELVDETANRMSEPLRKAGCSLVLDLEPRVEVNCDRLRIEQVLVNLLSNVIKYAPGKPVELKLRTSGQEAIVSVSDQGPGIPEDQLKKIFEPYHRVGATRTISGLGLGLYIVDQIVKAHQGSITAESRPGGGTVFQLKLPRSYSWLALPTETREKRLSRLVSRRNPAKGT